MHTGSVLRPCMLHGLNLPLQDQIWSRNLPKRNPSICEGGQGLTCHQDDLGPSSLGFFRDSDEGGWYVSRRR